MPDAEKCLEYELKKKAAIRRTLPLLQILLRPCNYSTLERHAKRGSDLQTVRSPLPRSRKEQPNGNESRKVAAILARLLTGVVIGECSRAA